MDVADFHSQRAIESLKAKSTAKQNTQKLFETALGKLNLHLKSSEFLAPKSGNANRINRK